MKSSFPRRPLSWAVSFGLAAAALLCAGRASAQSTLYTFQVTNGTLSGGDPVESVTDDLTFNNLVLTETFSDGFSTPVSLGSLDTGTYFTETSANLFDPTHGALASAVLSGTLGRSGFLPAGVLGVTLQQAPGGALTGQSISSAFSTTLSRSPFSAAPAGSISVGQFALTAGGSPIFGAAPTEIIVARAVPEPAPALTFALATLGIGGLIAMRRRTAPQQQASNKRQR